MSVPAPGFPIECVAEVTAPARMADGVSAGVDTYPIFTVKAKDFRKHAAGIDAGYVVDDSIHEARNRFFEPIPLGSELTIILGEDGIGHIVVWDCNS